MKQRVIVLPSTKMDENKKPGRDERVLVRLSASARKHLGFMNAPVELWKKTSVEDRITSSKMLLPFKAFAADVKAVDELIASGKLTKEDKNSVVFVTTDTWKRLNGKGEVWASITVEDTVIGADPEFLLVNKDGTIVNASAVAGLTKTSPLGSDGAMAEVRPAPAFSTEELVENIRAILTSKEAMNRIGAYEWRATPYVIDNHRDYPVGSHIHFGNPARIAAIPRAERIRIFNVVVRVLDELLAIPLIKLDGTDGRNRRCHCKMSPAGGFGAKFDLGYGWFGDVRVTGEPNGRLEYRTLSGKIMASPELLTAVYGTAKTIVDSVFHMFLDMYGGEFEDIIPKATKGDDVFADTFDGWKDIRLTKELGCIRSSKQVRTFLHKGTQQTVSSRILNDWLARLKGLPKYDEGEKYIQTLNEILRAKPEAIAAMQTNMQLTWKKE